MDVRAHALRFAMAAQEKEVTPVLPPECGLPVPIVATARSIEVFKEGHREA